MATEETINIIDLQIKDSDVIASLTKLDKKLKDTRESTKALQKEQKELSDNGKENTKQYKDNADQIEKNKASVKSLSTEYRNNQKVLIGLNNDQKNSLKTRNDLIERNKTLRLAVNKLDITTEAGRKTLKKYNAEINKHSKTLKDTSDTRLQEIQNIGNYKSALEGLPGPLGASANGMVAMTKAALAFIATPLGALIAALVGAFKLFQAAVKNSQPLMDKLTAASAAFSAVFKVIIDRVSDFSEKIVAAFEDPQSAVEGLWDTIKDNIVNRFEGLIKLFQKVGEGLQALWNRDLKGLKQAAKDAGQAMIQLTTGLDEKQQDKFAESIRGVVKEIKEEAAAASDLEKAQLRLQDAEIGFIQRRAELRREAEKALSLSKDQTKSDEERRALLQEYLDKQEEIAAKEVQFAKERARISQEQVDQGNSTREELRLNEELQAAAAEREAKLYQSRGRAVSLLSGLEKTLADERAKAAKLEADAKIAEFNRIAEEEKKKLAEEDQARADKLEADAIDLENQLALEAEGSAARIELLKQELDAKMALEIEAAEAVGADTTLIKEKYKRAKQDLDIEEEKFTLESATRLIGLIGNAFGKQTKVAKAAAAATTAIETYKGAIMAFNSFASIPVVGTVLGGIAAAAVGVSGAKAIQNIYATNSGLPGDSGGGGGVSVSGITSASVPSISAANINDGGVVGRGVSQEDNKATMKEAFSEALNEAPVKTAVVVDEITAKQEDIKTIETTATI